MGAGASRPAPRALVDAVEALGGATSAEVLELLDAFPRAGPEDHVPVTADDVAALSSRCGRLRSEAEVADAFDLPRRVAAVLMRRVPSVDDATGVGAPYGFSLADAVVHLARCRDSRAAALEEADALLRAGALVDLAKMATTATADDDDDDDDEVDDEVDARAPPLAALRTMLRARPGEAARRFPSLPTTARSLLLRSARASLAPRLRDAAGARLGLEEPAVGRELGAVQHTLTHMKLTLHVLALASAEAVELSHYTDHRWVDPAEPEAEDVGLSTLARKALAVAVEPPPQQQALF